ncbi:MAG: RNase A-like domain-containing protein [Candidatus Acidiferrum sp.]
MENEVHPKLHRWLVRAIVLSLLVIVSGCGQNPAPQTSPHEESRSAVSGDNKNLDRYDLERDESRGGHTLARHVARSDSELAQRLRKERNISAASTWTNREIAEETVGAALRAERRRIDNWIRRGERRPNLALHYNAGSVIGRSLRRGTSESVPCTSAIIVLRADGPDNFYVLTTYPEARE